MGGWTNNFKETLLYDHNNKILVGLVSDTGDNSSSNYLYVDITSKVEGNKPLFKPRSLLIMIFIYYRITIIKKIPHLRDIEKVDTMILDG